jgi:hypothetical protein
MGLSEREQQLLDELERGLYASDSSLAHKLGKPGARSPKRIIAGVALAIIGLSLLVVAVILQFALFGVAGFLVMLAGLILATSSNHTDTPAGAAKPKPQAEKSQRSSFFEDRWNKRQGQ